MAGDGRPAAPGAPAPPAPSSPGPPGAPPGPDPVRAPPRLLAACRAVRRSLLLLLLCCCFQEWGELFAPGGSAGWSMCKSLGPHGEVTV